MENNDSGISAELTGQITSDDTQPEVRLETEKPVQEMDEAARQRKEDEFVRLVHRRWKLMSDAEELQRRRSVEEVEFNSGKHWDSEMRKEREDKDQVVIEINRTPQFLNQVANEQRMTRPAAVIKPEGNGADEHRARILQGMVKSIEIKSESEAIHDDAFYAVLEKGWTYWRVKWQYESDRSFKKVVRTTRISNDFSVYCDPAATEYDKSDARDYVITEDMPDDVYKAEFGESRLASMTNLTSLGDEIKDWIGDGVKRVAEYFYKDIKKEKLYALADDPYGEGKFEDELERDEEGLLVGVLYAFGQPMFRMSNRQKVYWAKINAIEILDGNEDRTAGREYIKGGKYIPIIPAHGRRMLVEKKRVWAGMVRDAIEPCLASDYWLSAITEQVALGSKAPWVVAYEAIAQYREMWDTANIENYTALFYDAFDSQGNALPAPFRNFGEPPIQAMTFILKFADEDLKRVMGIYNAGLGAPGPEVSGVAIGARQRESDVANFNYIDNFKRSISYETKVKLDYIRLVYDSKQVIEIVKPDGKSETVTINDEFKDPKTGEIKSTFINRGDYGVVVEVGASFNTKREQAANGINEYLKVDPGAAPLVGDILAEQLDFPEKDRLAKRLKHRVPPEAIQDEEDSDEEQKIPPAFQAQYKKQAQMLEQMNQIIEDLTAKLETEELKRKHETQIKAMELASQERQSALKAQIEIAKVASKSDLELLKIQFQQLQSELEAIRRPGPVEHVGAGATDNIRPNNPNMEGQ